MEATAVQQVKDWLERGIQDDPPMDAIQQTVNHLDEAKKSLEEVCTVIEEYVGFGRLLIPVEELRDQYKQAKSILHKLGGRAHV